MEAPPGGGADLEEPPADTGTRWSPQWRRPPEGARTRRQTAAGAADPAGAAMEAPPGGGADDGVGAAAGAGMPAAMEAPPGGGADCSIVSPRLTSENVERFERSSRHGAMVSGAPDCQEPIRPATSGMRAVPGKVAVTGALAVPATGRHTIIAPPAGGSTCLVPMNSKESTPRVPGSPRSMNATESTL